jgi:hypothetical protein
MHIYIFFYNIPNIPSLIGGLKMVSLFSHRDDGPNSPLFPSGPGLQAPLQARQIQAADVRPPVPAPQEL